MYLLDTSALKAISSDKLRLAVSRNKVAISTISVLELATHLNDSEDDAKYLRIRGNFLKCGIPLVLDDPFSVLSAKLGTAVNPTRAEDKDILLQLIGAVEESKALQELSAKDLIFPDGKKATCNAIGRHLSDVMAEEEDTFVKQVLAVAEEQALDIRINGQHRLTAERFLGTLRSAVTRTSPDMSVTTQVRTLLATCCYYGYLVSRLYFYANKRHVGQTELTIDRNDCEDAYICLHLDLSEENVLVTNDQGTINAITETLALLGDILPIGFTDTYVISSEEFVSRIEA